MKLGYYSSNDMPSITSIADNADTVFGRILKNSQVILNAYLDQRPQLCYNLRNRTAIIEKTVDLNDRNF